MGAKKHTLYSTCCQAVVDEETGRCNKCQQWEPDPIPEPDLKKEDELYYFD